MLGFRRRLVPPCEPRRLRANERPAGRQATSGFPIDSLTGKCPYVRVMPVGGYTGSVKWAVKWAQAMTGPHPPTAGTIHVDPAIFQPGDLINVVRTGEKMLVVATDGDRIYVNRAVGSSQASNINLRDDLMLIGSAVPRQSIFGT